MKFTVGVLVAGLVASAALPAPASAEEMDEARFELGREVFLERAEPQCAICHALADAGADGSVGPDLDWMRPDFERVRAAVVNGIGPMMPYEDLNEEEIDALAYYVSVSTGAEE